MSLLNRYVENPARNIWRPSPAEFLMWQAWKEGKVEPAPSSWEVIFDPRQAGRYTRQISLPDDPTYIADAAVYLRASQPDLGIENPYELDEDQFYPFFQCDIGCSVVYGSTFSYDFPGRPGSVSCCPRSTRRTC